MEHDISKFDEAIKIIKEDDNARWFGNGDLLELIPPNYKINQRGQNIPPEDQYMEFVERVKPIRNKCLFIRGGNHDYLRSFNILDFDVCKVMAKELNVPYYRLPGYAKIKVSGKEWYLVSGHGKSGGKNGDLELDKMATVYPWGDIFFLGHNHQLYAKLMDSIVVDDNDEETLFIFVSGLVAEGVYFYNRFLTLETTVLEANGKIEELLSKHIENEEQEFAKLEERVKFYEKEFNINPLSWRKKKK